MVAGAVGLGLVIGLFLGCLGGGGGVLVVPALVYLLGQTAQHATTSSLIIVGLTAVAGTLARLRGGLVDWRTALAFGVVGTPAAYLGTRLNQHVAQHVLLLAFAALTLAAAAAMLVNSRANRDRQPDPGELPARDDQPDRGDPDPAGATGTLLASRAGTRTRTDLALILGKVLLGGVAVGFLTGFLGVGGGFLVVPVLVIGLRIPMTLAVGTSLMIIALNSVTSFLSRLGTTDLDWKVIAGFTLAAVVGSLAGKRLGGRFSGTALGRAFAIMLILVGGLVAAQSLGAF
jgi:uncharacterized protein